MPKPDFLSNFKYFFHIIWALYYWVSTKILILKHIFHFQKSVKGGPWQNFLQLRQTLTGHCAKARFSFELQIFFQYYLSSLLLIKQKKNLILKHIFYFLKSVKGGTLDKTFATPANWLIQHKNFIWSAFSFF